MEERIIEPYWMDVLDAIEGIDLEIESHGYVRDYGVYEQSDDDEAENVTENVQNLSLNSNENGANQEANSLPGMIKI